MSEALSGDKLVAEMKKLVAIQGSEGNWNYDQYMQGMFNGMELMLSIAEGREPDYKKAPETWIKDIPNEDLNTDAVTKLGKGQSER